MLEMIRPCNIGLNKPASHIHDYRVLFFQPLTMTTYPDQTQREGGRECARLPMKEGVGIIYSDLNSGYTS